MGVKSGAQKDKAVPAPLVAPVMLLVLNIWLLLIL